MGMSIDESITELEKARDSIEPCLFLDEAIDQSMKTAIEVMRKYQKIEQIVNNTFQNITKEDERYVYEWLGDIKEVIEDGKID